MKYVLDTNICIYAIKKDPIKVHQKLIEHLNDGICISAITLAELEHGVYKSAGIERNAENLTKLTRYISVLPFDSAASVEYGKICAYLQKAGTPIGTMDTLIAAHARSRGLTIVTNNVREFERVPDLIIDNWVDFN